MSDDPNPGGEHDSPSLSDFLDEPTRDLAKWRALWREDLRFPVRSHRGFLGRLIVGAKRLLRPVVEAPQADLWERQRVFNAVLLERLEHTVQEMSDRIGHVERLAREGLHEVIVHDDALYAALDQKLDRYRRETKDLQSRLSSALARAEEGRGSAEPLSRARAEVDYVSFEERYRGATAEIRVRLASHLPLLAGRGPVLDLGCGRGELLELLRDEGIEARGVDGNAEMVARCRERDLDVEEGDLLDALREAKPGSLGAVVSIHVVEHLPSEAVERLVRLSWGALRPGGLLLLETPNPLSLRVGASRFWIDPTHRRPVHPETLRWMATAVGFDPVEIHDLQPFPDAERLPEIPLELVPEDLHDLVDRLNRQRDRIDDLLNGFQDYALVGIKPGGEGGRAEGLKGERAEGLRS